MGVCFNHTKISRASARRREGASPSPSGRRPPHSPRLAPLKRKLKLGAKKALQCLRIVFFCFEDLEFRYHGFAKFEDDLVVLLFICPFETPEGRGFLFSQVHQSCRPAIGNRPDPPPLPCLL